MVSPKEIRMYVDYPTADRDLGIIAHLVLYEMISYFVKLLYTHFFFFFFF